MLITMQGKYFIFISMNSKVIEGHKSSIIKCFCLSFLSHFFLLPKTFIYASILIKINMNANYYDKQIFYLYKHDLKRN